MTQVTINGSDTTTVHLLHLDLPAEAVERFTTMAGTGEWPLKYALGATRLRPGFVDTVRIRDLDPLTLSQYLDQAWSVPAQALGADRARIDALTGHAVILPPQAFENTSQTLAIAAPLRLVGSYSTGKAKAPGAPLHSESARGIGSGGAPAPAGRGMSGLLKLMLLGLGLLVLLVVALILR